MNETENSPKPCPFCEYEHPIVKELWDDPKYANWVVECVDYGARGPSITGLKSESESAIKYAIKMWDRAA